MRPLRHRHQQLSSRFVGSKRHYGSNPSLPDINPQLMGPHQKVAHETGKLSYFRYDYETKVTEDGFRYAKTMGNPLNTSELIVDKRCFGIPFKIDDAQALDAAINHHKTSVRLEGVERLMLPFWFGSLTCGGHFTAELLQQDPNSLVRHNFVWNKTPAYEFSYPFGDHYFWNQISASYYIANTTAENLLGGNHGPSMLISRFELREELEELKVTPEMIPFVMSSTTACEILTKRLTRERVESQIEKELRKFYGKIYRCRIRLQNFSGHIRALRPIYLPMYKLMVCTSSNSEPVPTYICGATGKTSGPIVHVTGRQKFFTGFGSGLTTFGLSTLLLEPQLSMVIGALMATGSLFFARWFKFLDAARFKALEEAELRSRAAMNHKSDQEGFKWTVADEEASEYVYREEVREKARRRADFERRVREESQQEEAKKTGRAYRERARASKTQQHDPDPLGYYEILGLKGVETKSTVSDIGKAFRAQAHKSHPDIQKEMQKIDEATHRMQKLVEAYTVLRDKKLRGEYDSGQLGKV